MINQAELEICRRRGHETIGPLNTWTRCGACGTWLREAITVEEREDTPVSSEFDPLFVLKHRYEDIKLDVTINRAELEICRRRRHVDIYGNGGWSRCTFCGMWARKKTTLEESEEPPDGKPGGAGLP